MTQTGITYNKTKIYRKDVETGIKPVSTICDRLTDLCRY